MNLTSEGNKLRLYGQLPMPMDTHGQNFGYSAKAEIPQSPAGYAARWQRSSRLPAERLVAARRQRMMMCC